MRFPSKFTTIASLAAVGALATTASAQIEIYPSAPQTPFVTIVGAAGTTVIAAAADDSEHTLTAVQLAGYAGNDLLAAGVPIMIGNNGAVIWNPVAAPVQQVGYVNRNDFPIMAGANGAADGNGGPPAIGQQFICPLWDDHFPTVPGAAIYWQVAGGNLTIEWVGEDHFNAQGVGTVQFQMKVYGGVTFFSRNPLVEFIYNDTLYLATRYQNDGGSATIGYKNWNGLAGANDVEYGLGGGTNTLADPVFGDPSMQPKVAGWAASETPTLPHSLVIKGGRDPVVYCTCGTSFNGCCATISADANPTVAQPAGQTIITVTNVEGQKQGIIFYGTAPAATSWCLTTNSFLCIKAPTLRTTAQSSGGTANACDGTMTLIWNDWQNGIPAFWPAHQQFFVQAWYRDPPSCKTTNLSNAVKLTYQP